MDRMQAVLEPASLSEHQSSNIQDACVLLLHMEKNNKLKIVEVMFTVVATVSNHKILGSGVPV